MIASPSNEPIDYEDLAESFNQALLHTLRKHSVADSFLDYWVPDADPVVGIGGMADSARIAGLPAITIRFRSATVPEHRLPELEDIVSRFAKVTFERSDSQILLHATEMKKDDAGENDSRARSRSKPTYWQADEAAGPASGSNPQSRWDSGEVSAFGDVHPRFRQRLEAALRSLAREGEAGPLGAALIRCEGREGDVDLVFDVDPRTHIVRTVHHLGATKPSERAALDLFCRAAENLPFQEVADHVGLNVIHALVDHDEPAPVGGVLLPVNAGLPFMLAPKLARQAYDSYRAAQGGGRETNFYYRPPSAAWQSSPSAEREASVARGVRGFLQSENLDPDDIALLRIEKNKYGFEVRVVVGFSDRLAIDDKPILMRRLERRLRRDLEPEIELVADRAKDTSPLRRLS